MKCAQSDCQRAANHLGPHAPVAAEAKRLDIVDRYVHELTEPGRGADMPTRNLETVNLIAAARSAIVEHHRQCDPLSAAGCRCGKWALDNAVRAFEARFV